MTANERTRLSQLPPITAVDTTDLMWISHYVSPGVYVDRGITYEDFSNNIITGIPAGGVLSGTYPNPGFAVTPAFLAFKTIAAIGQSDVVALDSLDTLTLVAGTNITITTDATNREITINSSGGGGGGGGTPYTVDQTPDNGTYGLLAGTVNGSNKDFTVSNGSYISGTLVVYLNGVLQLQGASDDFKELVPGSGTFEFNTAPPSGSLITVTYQTVAANSTAVIVEDEGIALTTAVTTMNFTGSGVTATAVGTVVTVDIPAGGSVNANDLVGTALAANVVTSSLTSVGTLTNLTVTNPITGSVTGNAGTCTTIPSLSGDVSSSGNAITIANNAVTTAKINNNAVTLAKLATQAASTVLMNATSGAAVPTAVALSASELLGRGSSGNGGAITLGTNLSMSGTTLNATGGNFILISSQSASASSTINFTGLSTTYYAYKIIFNNVDLSTSAGFYLRMSTDNGSNYYSSGDYQYTSTGVETDGTAISDSDTSADEIRLTGGVNVDGTPTITGPLSGEINIINPANATNPAGKYVYTTLFFQPSATSGGAVVNTMGVGTDAAILAGPVNALRLLPSSGNITSGTFKLYGMTAA